MTTSEFDREFDILYNNVSSLGAPGLNIYEKSVFLTQAQEQLIKSFYSEKDSDNKSFELGEYERRVLQNLSVPYETTVNITNSAGLDANSMFFVIPTDTWFITQERVQISGPTECINNSIIPVKPITLDEYNVSSKSPFRKPNKRKAWRLDVNLGGGSNTVEIISEFAPIKYMMRYIVKPKPIVLVNLDTDPQYTGMNLTIDGIAEKTECALNSVLHRTILERSVELAILGYRENNLSNRIELNKRNV